jgi:hypothetical protein
VQSPI